jgi:hypothetical protein
VYRYRYINQHSQFGRTTCTLILSDLEGDMPDVRIDKEFGMSANQLDNEILYQEAAKEIMAAQQVYNDVQAALAAADNSGDQ